ncbi:MAG: AI-2E family transporter [Lactobacillaceae bacterium]|jgi:predicted PurR-regulated permease PerM|nr:AI-2E family transporter [Lactobacillaceae bacterium]
MFNKLKNSRILLIGLELLVIATLILVLSKISFIFGPIQTFIATLFGPFLFAGFLYYLLNPLINLLEKIKIKRGWGILIAFLLLFGLLLLSIGAVIPQLVNQISHIISNLPTFAKDIQHTYEQVLSSAWAKKYHVNQLINQINLQPTTLYPKIGKFITQNFGNFGTVITSVSGFAVSALTVPVILYYLLKDGHKLVPNIQRLFPERFRSEVAELLTRMNQTISTYFAGQFLDMLFVGTLTFIGYLIIRMPYALLLAFIAGLMNIVPYLGPWLGVFPAILVALTVSFPKAILVAIVVIIVQQLDGNLIYPHVIGKTLQIHPLTIIVLILVAGNMFGFLGIVLCIPVYAVGKTTVKYLLDFYRLRKKAKTEAAFVAPKDDSK